MTRFIEDHDLHVAVAFTQLFQFMTHALQAQYFPDSESLSFKLHHIGQVLVMKARLSDDAAG